MRPPIAKTFSCKTLFYFSRISVTYQIYSMKRTSCKKPLANYFRCVQHVDRCLWTLCASVACSPGHNHIRFVFKGIISFINLLYNTLRPYLGSTVAVLVACAIYVFKTTDGNFCRIILCTMVHENVQSLYFKIGLQTFEISKEMVHAWNMDFFSPPPSSGIFYSSVCFRSGSKFSVQKSNQFR